MSKECLEIIKELKKYLKRDYNNAGVVFMLQTWIDFGENLLIENISSGGKWQEYSVTNPKYKEGFIAITSNNTSKSTSLYIEYIAIKYRN